jgi:hypothetical protein
LYSSGGALAQSTGEDAFVASLGAARIDARDEMGKGNRLAVPEVAQVKRLRPAKPHAA